MRERLEGIGRNLRASPRGKSCTGSSSNRRRTRYAGDRTSWAGRGKSELRCTLNLTPISVAKFLKDTLWNRMEAKKGRRHHAIRDALEFRRLLLCPRSPRRSGNGP